MSSIFYINFTITDESDRDSFKRAFSDLHDLTLKMLEADDEITKNYVQDPGKPDELWLRVEDEYVFFMSEVPVDIELNVIDQQLPINLRYYFGKAYPTPPEMIGAVFAIFKHYFPNAVLSNDCDMYVSEFADGAYLAQAVNPDIKNPIEEEDENPIVLSQEIRDIVSNFSIKPQLLPEEFSDSNEEEEYADSDNNKRKRDNRSTTDENEHHIRRHVKDPKITSSGTFYSNNVTSHPVSNAASQEEEQLMASPR